MNTTYDFILFENYHLANHHKFDVVLIARMLRSQGRKVAIFDVFHEDDADEIEGIPVVHWKSKALYPDDSWMLRKHSCWETLHHVLTDDYRKNRYMREVKAFIEDKADRFYCGSYYNGVSTVLFDIKKPCYWWGLRSERLRFSFSKFWSSPIVGLNILKEKHHFMRNPYQCLFVSNQIILKEHELLGISKDRMVIREERVIENISDTNIAGIDDNISFLVIGELRPQKQVPFTVQAFQTANIPDSTLKFIGKSQKQYEDEISKAIVGDKRIIRVNSYLDYADFNRHFLESHFVLFADKQGPSCITNGTMMEALINHRPIICPDYDPYRMYVEKYGIGLLYKSGDVDSYAEALTEASALGVEHFQPAISSFLQTILFDKAAEEFVKQIYQE